MRNAVAVRELSYGASIRTNVSDFLSVMTHLLVPDGLYAVCELVDDDIDLGRFDTTDEAVVWDSTLTEREVVRENLHTRFDERVEALRLRALARRQNAVLHQVQGHVVALLFQARGEIIKIGDVVGFERVSRLNQEIISHISPFAFSSGESARPFAAT